VFSEPLEKILNYWLRQRALVNFVGKILKWRVKRLVRAYGNQFALADSSLLCRLRWSIAQDLLQLLPKARLLRAATAQTGTSI